ncbi:MAG: hypothetical protein ETSY1_31450 [Candidatus Entotheonella factor]|uniref:Uncharacterized protein n=1 Tax=Entotheonella factor TaxID=1429438 RepID=W4LB70_ENTF1|nr:MAG: hypothetical protein ETSY1_31450 [Candidatus Entotheonella factor]
MAAKPHEDRIEEIRRKADDFARQQHADVFKRFEQLLKPSSKDREGNPIDPSEDG